MKRPFILTFCVAALLFSTCKPTATINAATAPPLPPPVAPTMNAQEWSRPKLMVGIVVDQFRYDYLERYWEDLGDDGFKRVIEEGFYCRDNHFGYAPTYTGPGHASVYTGTTPAVHGIIANNWYVRDQKAEVYCAHDTVAQGVGVEGYDGQMSPHRMLSSTITDELRLFSNHRSKVIAMSMKDRGAVLPAGHLGNAAYWFVGKSQGNFVSSDYYMDALPSWVSSFNGSGLADTYLKQGWSLAKPASVYDESLPDNNPYEGNFPGLIRPVFPYDLDTLGGVENRYELIKASPMGNRILTDFAIAALDGEDLGQDEHADFLCLSYSSTDYVGHQFGTMAQETQDTYIRLDQDLATLLSALDEKVGKGEYTLFITADHGGVTNPAFYKSKGAQVGYYSQPEIKEHVNTGMEAEWGAGEYVESVTNDQIFFDKGVLDQKKIDLSEAEVLASKLALELNPVQRVITRSQLESNTFASGHEEIAQRGWSQKASGDVVLFMRPGWIEYGPTGTTHGSPYAYDTHVPLIFYGTNIASGYTYSTTYIRDIAPTVAGLLRIQMPNGSTGSPIEEVLNPR